MTLSIANHLFGLWREVRPAWRSWSDYQTGQVSRAVHRDSRPTHAL